jgi:predicted ThiF/HesA family dinucleotide-utilizing enzyme
MTGISTDTDGLFCYGWDGTWAQYIYNHATEGEDRWSEDLAYPHEFNPRHPGDRKENDCNVGAQQYNDDVEPITTKAGQKVRHHLLYHCLYQLYHRVYHLYVSCQQYNDDVEPITTKAGQKVCHHLLCHLYHLYYGVTLL